MSEKYDTLQYEENKTNKKTPSKLLSKNTEHIS